MVAPLNFHRGEAVRFAKDVSLVPSSPNVPHPILLLPIVLGAWAKGAATFPSAAKVAAAREALARAKTGVAQAQKQLDSITSPGEQKNGARFNLQDRQQYLRLVEGQLAQVERDSGKAIFADISQRAGEARELARQLLAAVEIVADGMTKAGQAAEAAGVDAKAFADGELLGASVRHLIVSLGLE